MLSQGWWPKSETKVSVGLSTAFRTLIMLDMDFLDLFFLRFVQLLHSAVSQTCQIWQYFFFFFQLNVLPLLLFLLSFSKSSYTIILWYLCYRNIDPETVIFSLLFEFVIYPVIFSSSLILSSVSSILLLCLTTQVFFIFNF